MNSVVTGLAAAARRCAALVAGLLILVGAAGRRVHAVLRRFAAAVGSATGRAARTAVRAIRRGVGMIVALVLRACRRVAVWGRAAGGLVGDLVLLVGGLVQRWGARLGPFAAAVGSATARAARTAVRAIRRGVGVIAALVLRACRLVAAAGRSAALAVGLLTVAVGAIRHRAHARLLGLSRSAASHLRGAGGRVDNSPRSSGKPEVVGSGTAAARRKAATVFGSVRRRNRVRRPSSIRTTARRSHSHRKLVLPALAAIVASGLSGIALGRVLEPEAAPSSITRSGLTVNLPPGWEPAEINPGRPALTSPIAAVPSGQTKAGFVVGMLSSQAAAERMFEGVQQAGKGRTRVRLGALLGWRYAGLRPGPRLVGTGYLVPTTGGAVVMLCHASKDDARAPLAECARAATTMVVSGERPRGLPSVDRSREQLNGVIATLRSSRSEGRERLAASDSAPGQIRAAISLKVSHQRAARSVERISPLENGHSLDETATALRAAAAAYGRLAVAAATGSRSTYQEASSAVAREEGAIRRELARVSSP